MLHEELTGKILEAAFEVSRELGHGFLEAVYRKALAVALSERGLSIETECPFQVVYHGTPVGEYRADLIVDHLVLLEIKSVKSLLPEHQAQLINYLKVSQHPVGLLLNFGNPKLEFRRCHS
ncbi:MAG: GxxExxY protein [Holophaga sp.]|nr:GxxExxY protein [Holophaga sp.]